MSTAPAHRISLAAATAIVVATMVGTGVFTGLGWQIFGMFTPDQTASGFPILMLWVVGGIAALCGALSYAEFTCMMPRSGGEYHLLGQAYHPLIGFLAGWVSVTAGFSAPIAATAMLFGQYIHRLWGNVDATMIAYAVVAALTLLQLSGVRVIAKFQVSMTVMKALLIVAFIAGAYFFSQHGMNTEVLKSHAGDSKHIFSESFASALFYVMYAYAGWNGAVYVAGEMKNPQRNLPLALLLGTLIVMVLYVGINAVFLMGGNWSDMAGHWQDPRTTKLEEVAFVAANEIFGGRGGWWMSALIAFGLLSTVNAILWTGAAVLRVIGQDMRALCWLNASDQRGEPVGAVLFMTNLVLLLLGTGSFDSLVNYIQALLQLCSMMVVIAVVWWRIKKPDAPRPFRIPLFPLPPIIFIGVSIWMLYAITEKKPTETAWGLITLVIGTLIYYASVLGGGKEPSPVAAAPVIESPPPASVPMPPAPESPSAPAVPTIAPFPVTPSEPDQP
jgi:APA family basic amino acid/polyamine antiporter